MFKQSTVYRQKSNHHAKINAYLIITIVPDADNEKNFTALGRPLPSDHLDNENLDDTKQLHFTGFDDSCKRPVPGDVYYLNIVSGGDGSWNTMENFVKYWELEPVPDPIKKPESIRPSFADVDGKIINIDLRPILPQKDGSQGKAIVTCRFRGGTLVSEVSAETIRRFNPKIGWHLMINHSSYSFVSPQEFMRMVFTTFDAQRKQEQ